MEFSMVCLNDNCLSSIFDHLRLREQITLTAICERFRDIILAVQWRSRFRRFETNGNSEVDVLTSSEIESLLKIIVHRIHHLVILPTCFCRNVDRNRERPDPSFYARFVYPVLRVLDILLDRDEVDMEQVAAHCPQIEMLTVHKMIKANCLPHIVCMRHLRVLHMRRINLNVHELKQILTLPLTELRIKTILGRNDHRSLAEALIGASGLRVLEMLFYKTTLDLMKSIVDLASTTETRDPLTVIIDYGTYPYTVTRIHYSDAEDADAYFESCALVKFLELQRSLPLLMGKQLANPPHTILLSEDQIECRFFSPIE